MNAFERWTVVLGLVATAVSSAPAAAQSNADSHPVFRTGTRLVVLQAAVTNARGEALTDLRQADFEIKEDGQRQEVAVFRRDDEPISLGLLLDNSGSMRHKRADIEAAALAFIRASNADDEVFVLNFADEPHLDVPLTSDLSTLEAGMRKLDAVGGTALRDALSGALTYLGGHAKHERRALLIVTDGTDNASRLSKSAIRELCRQAQAAIYAVGLVGEEDRRRAAKGRAELEDLTDATGGLAYFPERIDDVRQTVLGIARQLRNQYTVAYSPSNQVLDGRYRRIELRVVSRRGVHVRTRPGYNASPDAVGQSKGGGVPHASLDGEGMMVTAVQ